jgi:hypothetical protein
MIFNGDKNTHGATLFAHGVAGGCGFNGCGVFKSGKR